MFAKEGYPFIIASVIFLLVLTIIPKFILVTIAVLLVLMMFWFFRDPERIPPYDEKTIVSAADGKIVEISTVIIDGERFHKVSVFMNVFSVHVNRAPYAGRISNVKHIEGTFVPADKPQASTENERCEIHFDTEFGPMIAVQVAGLVARRTVPYVTEDTTVTKGERIGMIKFSSRVDHYLPEDTTKVEVRFGDKVTAGMTTIASII